MKKYRYILILSAFITALLLFSVTAYAENVQYTVSGNAEPGSEVTLMITKVGADMSDLKNEMVKKLEVVTASATDGYFSADFNIDDAELNEKNQITNYELHSNLKELTIDSGIVKKSGEGESGESGFLLDASSISVDENGVVFVPLIEVFKKLGINMTETETGVYEGFGKNGDIKIVIGKETAEVDWVDIELPAPTKYENGIAMIPAYLIEDAARTSAPVYNSENNTLWVEYPDPNAVYEDYFSLTKAIENLSGISGREIISPDYFLNHHYIGGASELISEETVNVDDTTFDRAVRVTINAKSDGTLPEGKALRLSITVPNLEIPKGEVAVISFKARALYSADESRTAMATVLYERSDWQKALEKSINIYPGDWQQFDLLVYSDYYDMWNGSHIYFNLGGKAETFEIGDFSLTYYGSGVDVTKLQPENPYKGMGDDALWRKEAYRRIEKYRKGDTVINVTDLSGNPIEGAQIEVNQTKNDYMFGIAVVADEVLNLDEGTQAGKIRKNVLENSCNTLVCGSEMKSAEMIRNDGVNGIKMVNEFLNLGKRIRGHTIFWDGEALLNIDGYESMPYEEAYRKVMDYVIPTAYLFKGKIQQWDVLNEILEANFTRINHSTTRLYADVIKKVKEIDPDVKLYVNETGFEGGEGKGINGRITGFRELIEQMKQEGAPIDGIGIQAHCTQFYYPQGFYHDLDRFGEFADEIAITEYDFRNVRDDFADEHLRDMLLVTFSHPKTSCFTIWGYYDPLHWRNSAPFYDGNWNEKPAKAVWDKMINEDFMTDTTVLTDSDGNASFRGFYGDYDITVKANGLEDTFPYSVVRNQDNSITVIVGKSNIQSYVSSEPDPVPSPIEYSTWTEAKNDYYETHERVYDGVVIEGSMDDLAGQSIVKYGDKNLDINDDWLSGKVWGTYYGTYDMIRDEVGGTMYVDRVSGSDAANLRKHIASDIISDNLNLESSFIFETQSARCSSYEIEFALDGAKSCTLGYITNDKNGYHLKTLSGKIIDLSDNTAYELIITLVNDKNSYYTKYELVSSCEPVIEPIIDNRAALNKATEIDSIVIKPKGAGGKAQDVFLLRSSRLKYRIYDPIIKFSNMDYANIILDEDMLNFNVGAIGYAFVPSADKKFASGEIWRGFDNSYANGFSYINDGKYLWTLMPADYQGKQHTIAKSFSPVKAGENIKLTAKMRVQKLASFYNSSGYAKISLSSLDGNIEKDLIKLRCAGYGKTHEILMADQADGNGEVMYWASDWNNKDLDLTVNIIQNASGNYDITVSLYDFRTKNTLSYTAENYITPEEIEKLGVFRITAHRVGGSSDQKGSKLFGIKNILLTKDILESGAQDLLFNENEKLAVDFDNVTEWPFNADIVVGAYKDGKLINTEIIKYKDIDKAEGELRFTPTECGQDYFKLFLFDSIENIIPKKKAEKFNLTN